MKAGVESAKKQFVYFETRGQCGTASAPVIDTPTASGNVPDIGIKKALAGFGTPSGRNYNGRLCNPNEFHGKLIFANGKDATQARYNLMAYFEHTEKVQVGYKNKGQLALAVQDKELKWSVVE